MATPVRLNWMRDTFVAPGCDDLPAHIALVDGDRQITSAWQLSPEELAAVAATGLVTVQCLHVWPPMVVGAPTIEAPPEARWVVRLDHGDEIETGSFTDVLTLLLHGMMNGATTVKACRL